jgi:hypothetical protein
VRTSQQGSISFKKTSNSFKLQFLRGPAPGHTAWTFSAQRPTAISTGMIRNTESALLCPNRTVNSGADETVGSGLWKLEPWWIVVINERKNNQRYISIITIIFEHKRKKTKNTRKRLQMAFSK